MTNLEGFDPCASLLSDFNIKCENEIEKHSEVLLSPPEGYFKDNFDEVVEGYLGKVGCGAILRDLASNCIDVVALPHGT